MWFYFWLSPGFEYRLRELCKDLLGPVHYSAGSQWESTVMVSPDNSLRKNKEEFPIKITGYYPFHTLFWSHKQAFSHGTRIYSMWNLRQILVAPVPALVLSWVSHRWRRVVQLSTLLRQQLWNRHMPKASSLSEHNTAWSLEMQRLLQLHDCVNVKTVFILGFMKQSENIKCTALSRQEKGHES